MAVDNPWAIDSVPLSALEWRRAISGLLLHDTDPVSARPGVLSGCAVTVASLTATVGAGQLVVTPQPGSNGSYLVGMTATALTITAQNATYARIDRVIARVYDNSVDGSGQDTAAVEIVTGTPAASPVAPALPAGALELAQLQVPKVGGGSIVVVDRRARTGAAGAPRWFPDDVARDAAIPPADRHPNTIAVIGSGSSMQVTVHDGTAWQTIWPVADTGWLTTGLAITAATNFAISSYRLRRIGGRVLGRVTVAYSGTAASLSNGRLSAALPVCTMPAGWGSTYGAEMLRMPAWSTVSPGPAEWWARPSAQDIQLTGSTLASQTVPSGLAIAIDYLTD